MATDIKSTPARTSRVDQFIDRELGQTGSRLRTADIAWAILAAVAWALAVLLLLVVIDAWMVNLGIRIRVFGLAALVTGAILIFCRGALPPLVRRINPQYVARMIEKSGSSFHNSLVNYLLVKNSQQKTRSMVYEAVSQRAANDLSQVDEDRRVDFSSAIRMGMVVAGLVALMVAYIIFSPRNPWSSIGRILAPVARIAPASVVTVTGVVPGDATVYYGDRLRVSCTVRGQTADQPVRLLFSSRDGQIRDAAVQLEPTGTGGEFSGEIPSGSEGILTDLDYYVACGDGRSPEFHVAVRANPTIAVAQVEIVPPEYTALPASIQLGRGEIRAPEGSTIRILANSNQDMKLAWIELVSADQSGSLATNADSVQVVQSVNMEVADVRQARGEFVLLLDADRKSQKFSHYRIRFRTAADQRNELASLHPVQIIPDAAPEISIVRPESSPVELPVNSRLPIEVHASDLDYEISSVELVLDHRGSRLLDRTLELPKEKINQQVVSRYQLDPKSLNLKEGDEVVFFAKALDNRISPYSYAPDPNESVTAPYTVRIVAADPNLEKNSESAGGQPGDPGNQNPSTEKSEPEKNPAGNPGNQESADKSDSGDKSQEGSQAEQPGSSTGNNKSQNSRESGEAGGESKNTGEKGTEEKGTEDKGSAGQNQADQDQAGSGEGNPGGNKSESDPGKSEEAGGGNSGSQAGSAESGNAGGQSGSDSKEKGESGGSGDPTGGSQATANDPSAASGSGDSQKSEGSNSANESGNGSSGNSEGGNSSQKGGDGNADGGSPAGSSGSEAADSSGQAGSQNSGNNPGNSSAAGSGGQRDESLNDGSVEPLSKQATDSEKFEALREYLGKNPNTGDNQQSSGQSGNTAENQSAGSESSQSGSPNPTGNPAENPGAQGNSSEGSSAGDRPGDQSAANSQGTGNSGRSGQEDPGAQPKPGEGQAGGAATGSDASNPKKPDESQTGDKSAGQGSDPAAAGGEKTNEQGGGESGASDLSDPRTDKSGTRGGEEKTGDSGDPKNPNEQSTRPGTNPQTGSQSQEGTEGGESGGDKTAGGSEKPSGNQSEQGAQQKTEGGKPGQGQGDSGQQSSGSGDQPAKPGSSTDQSGTGGGNANGNGSATRGGSGTGGSEAAGNSADPPSALSPQEAEQVEYNRAATDLILKSLEEQKESPDPGLLKQMNMTGEELKEFLSRWQKMKDLANSGDPAAKKRYTEALRSLGLRDTSVRPMEVSGQQDQVTGMAEDGGVNRPSAELAPEFRAFLKSRNRVENGTGNR